MKLINCIIVISSIISSAFANYNHVTKYDCPIVSQITEYEIDIPFVFEKYSMGFSPGLGSGITFKEITKEGNIELFVLNDRGPSFTVIGTTSKDTIVFPEPTFSPFIGIVSITPEASATLTEVIPLTIGGEIITGLPIPELDDSTKTPVATDFNYKVLPVDLKGFDPECIDRDSEGNFWIGDEYRPALVKAEGSTGEIIEILTPGNGLPEILKYCRKNRAFEGLAVTPNELIYASIESILDFEGNSDAANFIRIIELDPITRKTRTLAYPFNKDEYISSVTVKISDLAAIDDTHFLIIEQGKTPDGMQNSIWIIDVTDATDISNISLSNGLPLEFASLDKISNVKCIKKTLLLTVNNYGWHHEKLEGIAIINPTTIAITNDNDFGFSLSINDIETDNDTIDVTGYDVDHKAQKLLFFGQESQDIIDVKIQKSAPTNIWIIEFKKKLLDFIDTPPCVLVEL